MAVTTTSDQALGQVEARTQELGRALFGRAVRYRPGLTERLQDGLMVRLMEDERLKTRLLRFVDVLAALDFDRDGDYVKRLAREYLGESFPHLPSWMRSALRTALADAVPAFLTAFSARRATRMFAGRFIIHGGAEQARRALDYLGRYGRYGTFNLLGERTLSDREAMRVQRRYLDLIRQLGPRAGADVRTPGGMQAVQISIKPSSLVADAAFVPADPEGTSQRAFTNLAPLLEAARAAGISVNLDMEHFEYRELIWSIFTRAFGPGSPFNDWDGPAIALQGYLAEAEVHANEVLAFARERGTPFQVRLVKGAYWDYEVAQARQMNWPPPVFLDKAGTDECFERMVWLLLGAYPRIRLAVGSHNIRSHAYAEAVREQLGLPEHAVEHQTLFRTAEGISRALARMGWVERDFVPSGELLPGMAYLVRRVLENSSLTGFLMQSRLGEDPEQLLLPPEARRGEVQEAQPPKGAGGFRNNPPKRLFVKGEREPFQRAIREVAARYGETYPLRLGDEDVYTKEIVPSISPSHPDAARPVGWVHQAGLAEARRAIQLANEAFPGWSGRSVEERAAMLRRAALLMKSERDELAAWIVHEAAKTWGEALADVDEAIDYLVYYAEQALRIDREAPGRYMPRGVVAVIPPWNFPIAIPCGMTSAALAAGNTAILKPAGPTPIITHKLVELLHRAGVPPEALIHLPGRGGTVGQMLVDSPNVDMVAFTGSRDVGTRTYEGASKVEPQRSVIKRAITEMGGKNAILVFPDGDMDEAVAGILQSAFGHANQKCSACSRVFAHRVIFDRLKQRLVEAVRSLPAGSADQPSTFIPPVITGEAKERILRCAVRARAEGEVLIDLMGEAGDQSQLLRPLIVEVTAENAASALTTQEEIFGPILALVPFETEDQAVEMANNTEYALTAGIFSRSPETVERMIRRIRAGNIYVNRPITGARVGIEPFGGFQMSGTGPKAGGEEYLYAFMTRRSGYRPEAGHPVPDGKAPLLPPIRTWDEVDGDERARRLTVALARFKGNVRERLAEAVAEEFGIEYEEALAAVSEMVALSERLLSHSPELTLPETTMNVPGQRSFMIWTTPRGRGLIATGDGTSPAILCTLIFGALLAGNGLIVTPTDAHRRTADIIIEALHGAGVPKAVLVLGPAGGPGIAVRLAEGHLEFAATDLGVGDTRAIYRALGPVEQHLNCLKALIATAEGPAPGEPGFLRLFTLPKAVAIRTLRHGAELELL
ncbi:MAG: bifunctional proline dehydrogenase/L-glutamate gamma-semialdehyde dehydrogenase [Chloroflexi bacterium]|nr:bifunctional proline dehydrogenase/L-glutamate gamma-semialdehyde dehydrogenase [Chloroflexota bacterium]